MSKTKSKSKSKSKGAVVHRCVLFAIFFLFGNCLVVFNWLVAASWKIDYISRQPCLLHEIQMSSFQLPIVPTVRTDHVAAVQEHAIEDVFRHATKPGGWMDVNSFTYENVKELRDLGQTIMSRKTRCGRPKVFGMHIAAGLEYCFWDRDYVSRKALQDFAFERHLVDWVHQEFRDLEIILHKHKLNSSACQLAFLDVGVNVGDWASPLIAALPATPFFGIEGTPSTSAIAAANMRTSIEHRLRSGNTASPALLLPFSLVSKNMVSSVRESGGLCYGFNPGNVGGQGIISADRRQCQPSLIAGGTVLSHALQSIASVQSCPGKQDWPRIYIAKFDIQRFEFKAITSALDWLSERPPCYIMIEAYKEPQTFAIIELLLDMGYDSVWRTHNSYPVNDTYLHEEFPPGRPYWSRSRKRSMSLHDAADADLTTISIASGNKDYIFGFGNKEMCIRRLVE